MFKHAKRGVVSVASAWFMMIALLVAMPSAPAASWSNSQDFTWSKPGAAPMVYHNSRFFILSSEYGVWTSNTGATWNLVKRTPPWAPRNDYMAVAFNGKIYVMGGQYAYTYYRDVWSSFDGISWTQETAIAPWSDRGLSGAVVFGGKLYLIGGVKLTTAASNIGATDCQYLTEIWSTTDCASWSGATNLPWSPRAMPALVAHNGMLFMMGGAGDSQLSDVWLSDDGASWARVTDSAPWTDDWSLSAASIGGKIYVMGGLSRKVWSSDDGTTWTQVTASAPWPATWGQSGASESGYYYLATGCELSAANLAGKIWRTGTGTGWEHIGGNYEVWSPRWLHRTVEFKGRIWVLGGMASNMVAENNILTSATAEVWRSVIQPTEVGGYYKLVGWEAVNRAAPWGARWGHQALSYNDRMWVLGGCDDNNNFGDVWSSAEGTTWTLVNATAWSTRVFHAAAVYKGRMWVIGGTDRPNTISDYSDCYYSINGVDWVQTIDQGPWAARSGMSAVEFLGKLWVIGGAAYSGTATTYPGEAYSTTDGIAWTKEASAIPFARRDFATVVADGKLWIIGGSNGGTCCNDAWSTADGVNWVLEGTAPWRPRRGPAAVNFNKTSIWVMGGMETEPFNDVWMLPFRNGAETGWLRMQ